MSLWRWLRGEAAGLLDFFLPPACPLCGEGWRPEADGPLCPACLGAIAPLPEARCPCCSLPYPTEEGSVHRCGACLADPPPFRFVRAVGLYDQALRQAVHSFKFDGRLNLDRPLGELLHQALAPDLADFAPNLILPVPLHLSRLRQRTYNQSYLLARQLSRLTGIRSAARLLVRIRPTPSQQGLKVAERHRNLKGAFALRRPLAGERVLLIDDVLTTGATARECCRTLLAGGAEEVAVGVIGRAARHGF